MQILIACCVIVVENRQNVDESIDELKDAEAYVHPDQKRVELLHLEYKELKNNMLYVSMQQLARRNNSSKKKGSTYYLMKKINFFILNIHIPFIYFLFLFLSSLLNFSFTKIKQYFVYFSKLVVCVIRIH
ncbi:hypothetical protein RFI_07235 [Reticulomyxa filosa]|uniref:Uncharacterized protein n=1 Tax=Reticulomyxa filosa TaxID=46433 RepID=X6NUC1_RETFI|nr:hypothetical protein RFI_07235 [Reticulomyxa filosa]|eukprot:ETO29885.1 hypothetical protein RFI_07235 [Reticulomyxa filosa]